MGRGERAPAPGQERRPSGALEAETLAALQAAPHPLTPAEVLERLSGGLSYSTVVTILTRLYEKNVLTRDKQGRAFAYAPVTDPSGLTARRMHQVMDSGPDRETVLARFVNDLSDHDERLLLRLLAADLAPGQRGDR
jgi:predicted transcriptional regulator